MTANTTSLIGRELKWTQPRASKKEYQLRAGDEVLATLHFPSSWRSMASAKHGDDCWTFKEAGHFWTHVDVRRCGDERVITSFKFKHWDTDGTLETPGGRSFRLRTNFWLDKSRFETESGEALVAFKAGGYCRYNAEVEIRPQAANLTELPLLLCLGWYLAVKRLEESCG